MGQQGQEAKVMIEFEIIYCMHKAQSFSIKLEDLITMNSEIPFKRNPSRKTSMRLPSFSHIPLQSRGSLQQILSIGRSSRRGSLSGSSESGKSEIIRKLAQTEHKSFREFTEASKERDAIQAALQFEVLRNEMMTLYYDTLQETVTNIKKKFGDERKDFDKKKSLMIKEEVNFKSPLGRLIGIRRASSKSIHNIEEIEDCSDFVMDPDLDSEMPSEDENCVALETKNASVQTEEVKIKPELSPVRAMTGHNKKSGNKNAETLEKLRLENQQLQEKLANSEQARLSKISNLRSLLGNRLEVSSFQ